MRSLTIILEKQKEWVGTFHILKNWIYSQRIQQSSIYSLHACPCISCARSVMARCVVLCKSNNKKPASDVLQLEFRQWELITKNKLLGG
jgi:hypothetical protein